MHCWAIKSLFVRAEACQAAFDCTKLALTQAPCLALANETQPSEVVVMRLSLG